MNWLFFVIIGFIALWTFRGYKKGFIRMIMSFVFLLLTLFLSAMLTPYISDFLQEKTPIYEYTQMKCADTIDNYLLTGGEKTDDQIAAIQNLGLPGPLESVLTANNNTTTYSLLAATNVSEYVGGYLAKWIINTITYIIVFILIGIILKIISHTMKAVDRVPVINQFNKILGMILGLTQAVLTVWIFFLIITVFASTGFGLNMLRMINENMVLSLLYDTNILMKIIMSSILGSF